MYWWTPADRSRKGGDDIERATTHPGGDEKSETVGRSSSDTYISGSEGRIVIDANRIVIPDWLPLEYEEREMLEIFKTKLREGQRLDGTQQRESEATHVHDSGNNTNNEEMR